jgi:hypothetical protein
MGRDGVGRKIEELHGLGPHGLVELLDEEEDLQRVPVEEGRNSFFNPVKYISGLGRRLFFKRPPEIMGVVPAFGHSLFDFCGYLTNFGRDLTSADIPADDSERHEQCLDLGVYSFKLVAAFGGVGVAGWLPFEFSDNPLAYIPAVINAGSMIGRYVRNRGRVNNFLRGRD